MCGAVCYVTPCRIDISGAEVDMKKNNNMFVFSTGKHRISVSFFSQDTMIAVSFVQKAKYSKMSKRITKHIFEVCQTHGFRRTDLRSEKIFGRNTSYLIQQSNIICDILELIHHIMLVPPSLGHTTHFCILMMIFFSSSLVTMMFLFFL